MEKNGKKLNTNLQIAEWQKTEYKKKMESSTHGGAYYYDYKFGYHSELASAHDERGFLAKKRAKTTQNKDEAKRLELKAQYFDKLAKQQREKARKAQEKRNEILDKEK